MSATAIAKLGACFVQAASNQASRVAVNSFWQALELSRFQSALDSRGVRLIGVGHDVDGVEEFQREQFFSGELYLDPKKEVYAAMGYGSVSVLSGIGSLFRSAGRALVRETKDKGVKGNQKGDGWQLGGLLVIEKGGRVLYSFQQQQVTENPDYSKVAEVLGVKEEELTPLRSGSSQPSAS
ncbi:unnamed protein product [Dibothriocephalus latus]|uniref:Peroxiredoxin-like 2 activated in M-CSF stimulated monocytes n=1 Tax=Dibothriocephalus latus TaxID=60516 RepID=A0A3P6P2W3_DIBLA|nr:unnamed protein product [Dibothriocephalus latus]